MNSKLIIITFIYMHLLHDTVAIVYNTYNLIELKFTDLSNTGYNYFPKEF